MKEARSRCEQALAIAREVAYCRSEASALLTMAKQTLLVTGVLKKTARWVATGIDLLSKAGDRLELAKFQCLSAHADLAAGRSAGASLKRLRTVASALGVGPGSGLGEAISMLSRAQDASDAGGPLIAGFSPQDITAGQVSWLRKNRPAALPADACQASGAGLR